MKTKVADNRFITHTNWDGYLKYLDAVGDSHTRVTYDRGTLELLSPSNEHEQVKSLLGRCVELVMMEAGIDFQFGGSTTFKRQDLDRGLEPDECYWSANWRAFLGRPYDSQTDPPPDLVVEVDITSSSINRMESYLSMGVPEVWLYGKDGQLRFYRLSDNAYVEQSHTSIFPRLASVDLARFLAQRNSKSSSALLREFCEWWRRT